MPLSPVRSFDGRVDQIRCHPGDADISGAWTIAALLRPAASGFFSVYQGHLDGVATGYGLEINTTWRLGALSSSGGEPFSSNNFLPTAAWTVVAVAKPLGWARATVHRYDFATRSWLSQVPTEYMYDPERTLGPEGFLHFGTYENGFRYRGELAAVAVWDAELSPTTVAELTMAPSLSEWAGIADPRALWLFDQMSIETDVLDLIGDAHEHDRVETTVVGAELPIPYRAPRVAVHDGAGWSDRTLLVHDGASWTNPTSVGVL